MRKHGIQIFLGLLGVLLLGSTAFAGGDVAAGEQKSAVCASCHGATGESIAPDYPVLAGQHQSYLEQSLKDYRSGARNNPIMAAFVATLSDEDIADLSAYFAAQEGLFTLSK